MEYEERTNVINEIVIYLLKSFPGSFLNQYGEFIAHREANEYLQLSKCKDDLEVKCKVLEWLSRAAYKTEPYKSKKKNEKFNDFMLRGINKFLNTDFDKYNMMTIYQELGNQVNRELTIKFINSNYDMAVLQESEEIL